MRVLAAFDKFKDSFSAEQACSLVESTAGEFSPNVEVVSCPLTDGGEGFVDILISKCRGDLIEVKARDSLGRPREAAVGMVPIDQLSNEVRSLLGLPESGKLAIIEMASICGLGDLDLAQRDPWNTTTLGIGDLLLFGKEQKADFILLGIGGSSTNDAGIGALCALGLALKKASGESVDYPSPSTWADIATWDRSSIVSLPPLIIACDVDNPLLGSEGATAQFGPQKGLPPESVAPLENAMNEMVVQLEKVFPHASALAKSPGAGAAGGIGFGLSLVGEVKLVQGFELVSQWLSLKKEVNESDLILTGEGRFDSTSWRGKGPFEILSMAKRANKKAILLCGSLDPHLERKTQEEFPNHKFIPFAKSSWKLAKNLKHGPKLFREACRNIFEDLFKGTSLECPIVKEARFKRIRRLKKFLRPLPRRSNVHRYPVLKWFADTAYQRSFLWSFKGGPIQAALFWGIWISMLPIVGIQMIVVFFVSLFVRANLPLIVALQWISNPLTMGPIYFADYKIGMTLLKLIGVSYPKNKLLSPEYDWAEFSYKELLRLIDTFPPMFLGGSVLGISFGVSTVFLYKILRKFYKN